MKFAQIQQMVNTLGIDQNAIMKYIQDHPDYFLSAEMQDYKEPIIKLLDEMDLNFYQKLQMYSPLVNMHRDVSHSSEMVHLHSHSFYEILYCESGNIQYLIGDNRYSIRKGDIILVPPGISHRPIFQGELVEPYSRIVLWVSSDFMTDLIKKFPDSDTPDRFIIRTSKSSLDFLKTYFVNGVRECQAKNVGWESYLYYNTGMLLTELYRAMGTQIINMPKAKEDELDQIISYIENNYMNRITLEDTAKEFLISQSTLSKLFQNNLEISFYRFVTQRRLINAKKRIEDGESLDTIGNSCGFNDYATFYRAFKKEYGLAPREYQKLVK